MRRVVLVALVALSVSMVMPSGTSESTEERREYLGGGSMMGTTGACLGEPAPFDLLVACNIPCPGGTCDITVIDDVRGTNISFRICFEGETFCRPNRYIGHASVEGSKVTVVPSLTEASHGVVIVR